MLADTQAAHSIGGFKIGVGFSLRKCRTCLATKETMSVWVSQKYCVSTLLNLRMFEIEDMGTVVKVKIKFI